MLEASARLASRIIALISAFVAHGRKGRRILPALVMGLAGLGNAIRAPAQTTTILYSFGPPNTLSGANPNSNLVRDSLGNLYGTTANGGITTPYFIAGCGTVFELVNSSGSYTAKPLYAFGTQSNDGITPHGVVMDASGDLFGATSQGGAYGGGTVFELVNSAGSYAEQLLYGFGGTNGDGTGPAAGLIMDAEGNFYGTTAGGGINGAGTVFELVNSAGSYTEKVLYSFASPSVGGPGADGANPFANLLMDAAGNLYGTTKSGGAYGGGTVFELVNSSGSYAEHILYNFGTLDNDGLNPAAGLIMDSSGNLYGTTGYGGANNFGTVFELVLTYGIYSETILHSFTPSGNDGANPQASLVMDGAGNLYGTTANGGISTPDCSAGCGTVFELVNSSGSFQEKVLDRFGSFPGDGEQPVSAPIVDPAGNLDGATALGGTAGTGTVFEVNPTATGSVVTLSPTGLNFGTLAAGTESTESLTAQNSGSGNLIFGSDPASLSGANAADFVLTADSCSGATVPPQGTCSLSIRFAPSQIGPESATLTLTDNAANSPQTVSLSATGAQAQDFTIGIATGSSNSQEISQGSTATYVLSVTPLGGFSQTVTFTCTGGPGLATCTVNPASLKMNGSSASTTTVTVTTTAPGNYGVIDGLAPPAPRGRDKWRWFGGLLALAAMVLVMLSAASLREKPGLQLRFPQAALVALLLTVVTWAGCTPPTSALVPVGGTPVGTYILTVTGTSSLGSTNLSHSISLTLTVDEVIYYSLGSYLREGCSAARRIHRQRCGGSSVASRG